MILYILLITVGICAIGVAIISNNKNEKRLAALEQQDKQKRQTEESKTSSSNLYQNFDEAKILNKSKLEDNIKTAKNYSIAKVASPKTEQEAVSVEKVIVAKPAIINAPNQAKIEANKIETNNVAAVPAKESTPKEVVNLAKEEVVNIVKKETSKNLTSSHYLSHRGKSKSLLKR